METIKDISLAIVILIVLIYVGVKSALFSFGVTLDFSILQALAMSLLFVCCVSLVTIGVFIAQTALKETQVGGEENAKRLLIAAIMSNDGEIRIQNAFYAKVCNGDGEYLLVSEDNNGVTTIKLRNSK